MALAKVNEVGALVVLQPDSLATKKAKKVQSMKREMGPEERKPIETGCKRQRS